MVAAPIKIKRIGIIKDYRLPQWIKEGYCKYVARDSSLPERKGIQLLVERKQNNSISSKYFVWRKMVEYSIDIKGYSFKQLIYDRLNQDEVEKEMIEWPLQKNTIKNL